MIPKGGQGTVAGSGAGSESGDGYEIRRYEPGDRGEFCSLYESVFGGSATTEWFDWKYVDDPFVDHVPIFLVERDGRLVGARPFFALEMTDGADWLLSFAERDTA